MHDTMYKTVRLPKILTDEIDEIIAKNFQGYRSRAEFIAEAIREKLNEINKKGGSENDK